MPKLKTDAKASPKKAPAAAVRGGISMETVAPNVGDTEAAAKGPRLEPSPSFLFKAHPERWLVMGGRVIPALAKLKLQAGVALVTKVGDKFQVRKAIADAEERGWKVIPWDVDGKGTSYLRSPAGRPDIVVSKWETVYSGSTAIRSDEAGYATWCRSLIDRGIIPPPPTYVLERMAADIRKRLDEAIRMARNAPSYQGRVDRLAADLKAVEAELAAVEEEVEAEASPVEMKDAPTPNVDVD